MYRMLMIPTEASHRDGSLKRKRSLRFEPVEMTHPLDEDHSEEVGTSGNIKLESLHNFLRSTGLQKKNLYYALGHFQAA